MYYIPLNNPTVTRLATIAADTIRKERCEVIFTYYFEPYALAAHLASYWTGIPYILKHAGSDLNRLMPLEELQTAYLEVLARANRVISHGRSREKLISYGVAEERISSHIAFGIPLEHFHPDVQPVDLNGFFLELADETEGSTDLHGWPLAEGWPVLGVYGKLGEYKGTFDLFHAMARLIRDGFQFYVVLLAHGWQEHRVRQLIEELGLAAYVRFLPFLPHWKIPAFIRSCTAIAFLERDFPIATHGPTIPTEVIACGTCLILSQEVAHKQLFRMQIRNRENIVIVPNPQQHDELAACIRFALEDAHRADRIGHRGFQDLHLGDFHNRYIDDLENLLREVANEPRAQRLIVTRPEDPIGRRDVFEMMSGLFPYTHALLTAEAQRRIREVVAGSAIGQGIHDRRQLAVTLGQEILSALEADPDVELAMIHEVCRYEMKLHELAARSTGVKETQSVDGITFSLQGLSSLIPTVRDGIEVVQFTCDVETIMMAIENKETVSPIGEPTKVLFHPSSLPLRVNEPTEYLLRLLASTSMTMEEVFTAVSNHYPCEDAAAEMQLLQSCVSVLEGLYWEGVIGFKSCGETNSAGI